MHNDFLVAMFAILCGTGTMITFIVSIKELILRWGARNQPDLVNEVRQLRAEIQALRQQNTDVVLALDTGLSQLERRLEATEQRSYAIPAGTEESVLLRR